MYSRVPYKRIATFIFDTFSKQIRLFWQALTPIRAVLTSKWLLFASANSYWQATKTLWQGQKYAFNSYFLLILSTEVHPEFHLGNFTSKADVVDAIQSIEQHRGETNTAAALQYVRNISFSSDAGGRDGVPHIVIVLTGKPCIYCNGLSLC